MKARLVLVIGLALLAAALGYWLGEGTRDTGRAANVTPAPESAVPPPAELPAPPPAAPVPEAPPPEPPPVPVTPPSEPGSARALRANPAALGPREEEDPAQTEADSIALNIRQYALRFGGNPVGANAEIVKELNGGNPKNARYLPAELMRLNDQGELIDKWGTPYFFHQESSDKMEVRSAGPDKQLYTTDDYIAQ